MALTDRAAKAVLAAVMAVLFVAAARARIPEFWSDGATYYSMAWSLAEDGDLRYEARDVLRVRREIPSGPQGIFLKRASGGLAWERVSGFPWRRVHRVGPDEPRIYYAKAFLYPLMAAPLVKLFGTRGLFLVNAAALAVGLAFGYSELRRRTTPLRALLTTLVLFLATVAPVYLFWPQPELLNLGLVAGALWAWRRQRPLLAAVILGAAIYSKPYNLLLALPLGLEPLFDTRAGSWLRRLLESAGRGAILAATTAAFFGLNAAVTGELNYQGGERKTFYGVLPFEAHGVTFGNSGQWMTTDYLGPLVEGKDEALKSRRTGPLRAPGEIRASFVRNLGYFWIGRFGGALPYYAPAVLALLVFLAVGPRDRPGWLAMAALVASWIFYIVMIPDNWYGGGGTVGNRYFLNLLPLAVLFWPVGREWLLAGIGAGASALLLWPAWIHPIAHSLRPGDHTMNARFGLFPPELTMLNDLGVCTEPWRKKRPYGDTEGDPHRNWPADPKSYFLYFLDNGTHGKATLDGTEGFWLRAGSSGQVVLRALEPVRRINVRMTAGPLGDEPSIGTAGALRTLALGPGQTAETFLEPEGPFPYYDTFLYVLRCRSRGGPAGSANSAGSASSSDSRGTFVQMTLEVSRRAGPGATGSRPWKAPSQNSIVRSGGRWLPFAD